MIAHKFETNEGIWNSYTETLYKIQNSETYKQVKAVVTPIIQKISNAVKSVFKTIELNLSHYSLSEIVKFTNKTGTSIEKCFNVLGSMPFVSYLSSPLRVLAGKLQILAGVILVAVGEAAKLLASRDRPFYKDWATVTAFGTENVIHGCLNVVRGTTEGLIAACTLGLGNLLLLAPNMSNNRNFSPYFEYGTLVNPMLEKQTPRASDGIKVDVIDNIMDDSVKS